MAYSSLTSIITIVPDLPNTGTSNGYSTTVQVVERHITRADAVINSKIAKRYSVPITPTPPFLAQLSEDITTYFTYRSFYRQDNHNKLDYFEELKEDAFSDLEKIREGELDLIDTSGSLIPEATSSLTTSMVDSTDIDHQPFFDVDDVSDWKFDNDLIDDIKDKRNK